MLLDNALLDDLNNQIFRNAGSPAITGPFVISLHTASPGTNRANEVGTGVWTNYARTTLARSTGGWSASADAAGSRRTSNAAIADFGTAAVTGTAPVVTHLEVWDSAGTPRRIAGKALTTPKTINNGDPVSFPVDSLRHNLTPQA